MRGRKLLLGVVLSLDVILSVLCVNMVLGIVESRNVRTVSIIESGARDTSIGADIIKETSAKETSAKETSAKETSAKETSAKETSAKETSAKETSAKETSAKETSAKETSAKEVSAKEEIPEPKTVALTFDDGPNEDYTEHLLDGLKERGVKATFFLVGECLEGNEELVRRMVEEGHLIGVHCMQHMQLTKEPVNEAVDQLEDTKRMIEEIGIYKIEYIRPPFGDWNAQLDEAVRAELSMEPVFWDVDSLDWELQNTKSIVRRVTRNVEDGDIILMHDEFATSVEAALQIIDNLMAKGYTFVTVNELVVD